MPSKKATAFLLREGEIATGKLVTKLRLGNAYSEAPASHLHRGSQSFLSAVPKLELGNQSDKGF